jgi:replicative DNA helicase
MKLEDKKRILQSVVSTIDDEKFIKKTEFLLGVKESKINTFDYYLKNLGASLKTENSEGKGSGFIKSGLRDYDHYIGGWKVGSLNVIAGHTGMGLSAFLITTTNNIATSTNQGVAVFSLMNSSEHIANRIVSSTTGMTLNELKNIKIKKPLETTYLNNKIQGLFGAPIFIDDSSSLTVISLKNRIRKLIKEENIKIVLLDGLEKIIGERQQIIKNLKSVAKELNIPIVAFYVLPSIWIDSLRLTQRPESKSFMKKYTIISMKDSIETLTFIYRPEYYGISEWEDGSSCAGQAELICYEDNFVKKDIRLKFIGHLSKFCDLNFEE